MQKSGIAYLEYGAGGKTKKKKIKVPKERTMLGIYKWGEGWVKVSWFIKNPRKYGYGKDNYHGRIIRIPKRTEWVRLRVGRRVLSRGK